MPLGRALAPLPILLLLPRLAAAQVPVNFDGRFPPAENPAGHWRAILPEPPRLRGREASTPVQAKLTRFDEWAEHLAKTHPEIPRPAVAKVVRYLKQRGARNADAVTIIDFNRPSDQRRMFVIGLGDGKVESYLVAHGSGSGMRYATKFSNKANSHQSSLGLYLTAEVYSGKHGRSLRLDGLEATNSAARDRAVVLHGAKYVSDAYAKRNKRVGRSWGCPAVDMKYRDRIIDRIRGGSVLLIYK